MESITEAVGTAQRIIQYLPYIYLLVINLIALAIYGIDKAQAKLETHRTPEKTLFLVAILGGSIGALLGMRLFHHKTRKWYFRVGIPLILVLQIVLVVLYFLYSAGLLPPGAAA